jgi:hypothetical protein
VIQTMKKDRLGILVNNVFIEGIRQRDTVHENVDFYQQGADKYGFIPCYFSMQDISFKKKSARAYVQHYGSGIGFSFLFQR